MTYLDQIDAVQSGKGLHFFHKFRKIVTVRRNDPAHGPGQANMAGQGTGVDAFDTDLVMLVEKIRKGFGASPVAGKVLIFLDDEGFHLNGGGFQVVIVDTVGPGQGIGHGHDLALIRRVRQDLLIPRHARVEDDFAQSAPLTGKGVPAKNCTIFEQQDRFLAFPDR